MPRETLKITFDHIQAKLTEIDKNLKDLPRELANEFEARFGSRITALEKEVAELKSFRLKFAGAMIAMQAGLAMIAEYFLNKH